MAAETSYPRDSDAARPVRGPVDERDPNGFAAMLQTLVFSGIQSYIIGAAKRGSAVWLRAGGNSCEEILDGCGPGGRIVGLQCKRGGPGS